MFEHEAVTEAKRKIEQHKERMAEAYANLAQQCIAVSKVSATEIMDFLSCRRKWDYGSLSRQAWEPIVKKGALMFGAGIHECLDIMYSKSKQLGVERWKAWLSENMDASEDGYDETLELGQAMLDGYVSWSSRADTEGFGTIKHVIATELEYEVILEVMQNTAFVLVGRFDMVVIDENDRIWIVDHKTSSNVVREETLEKNWQMATYLMAAQIIFGHPIEGIYYNVLRKKIPATPKILKGGMLSVNKSQDTTYELYLAAIEATGERIPEYEGMLDYLAEKGNTFFQRHLLRMTPNEIDIHLSIIKSIAKDMAFNPRIYPHRTTMCQASCQFRDVCFAEYEQGYAQMEEAMVEVYGMKRRETETSSVYWRN